MHAVTVFVFYKNASGLIVQHHFVATSALKCLYIIASVRETIFCLAMIDAANDIGFGRTVAFEAYDHFFPYFRDQEQSFAAAGMRSSNAEPGRFRAVVHPVEFDPNPSQPPGVIIICDQGALCFAMG